MACFNQGIGQEIYSEGLGIETSLEKIVDISNLTGSYFVFVDASSTKETYGAQLYWL